MGIDSVWLYVPQVIYIRISTVLMILVILTVVTVRTRSFGLAALTTLCWMGAYEIVWQIGYSAFGYQPPRPAMQFSLAVFGWLLLGHKVGIRPDKYLTALWALSIVVWMMLGFHANFPGTLHPGAHFSLTDEIVNEVGKTALGVAYLLGALRRPVQEAAGSEAIRYERAAGAVPHAERLGTAEA